MSDYVLGYCLNCDDAMCLRCFRSNGYGDAETYAVIDIDSETDAPSHCCECGDLIPQRLTDYGVEYVREAIETYAKTGYGAVAAEWATAYADYLT